MTSSENPAGGEDARAGWQQWTPSVSTTTGTVSWPSLSASGPARTEPALIGWKCADCGTVMAPWMATHLCPPGGLLLEEAGDAPDCVCGDDESAAEAG